MRLSLFGQRLRYTAEAKATIVVTAAVGRSQSSFFFRRLLSVHPLSCAFFPSASSVSRCIPSSLLFLCLYHAPHHQLASLNTYVFSIFFGRLLFRFFHTVVGSCRLSTFSNFLQRTLFSCSYWNLVPCNPCPYLVCSPPLPVHRPSRSPWLSPSCQSQTSPMVPKRLPKYPFSTYSTSWPPLCLPPGSLSRCCLPNPCFIFIPHLLSPPFCIHSGLSQSRIFRCLIANLSNIWHVYMHMTHWLGQVHFRLSTIVFYPWTVRTPLSPCFPSHRSPCGLSTKV